MLKVFTQWSKTQIDKGGEETEEGRGERERVSKAVSLNSNHLTALLENLSIMPGSTDSPPRITRMMALIVGTFCICWFPFAIMFMKFPFNFNQFEPDCGCPTNSSITVHTTNIPPTCPPLDRNRTPI